MCVSVRRGWGVGSERETLPSSLLPAALTSELPVPFTPTPVIVFLAVHRIRRTSGRWKRRARTNPKQQRSSGRNHGNRRMEPIQSLGPHWLRPLQVGLRPTRTIETHLGAADKPAETTWRQDASLKCLRENSESGSRLFAGGVIDAERERQRSFERLGVLSLCTLKSEMFA